MKRMTFAFALAAMLAGSYLVMVAQEGGVRLLDADAARRFLPDRVPMETEMIPVDGKSVAVLQFPDKTRFGVAVLVSGALTPEMKTKYQYVMVSETRLRLDRWSLPAGMVGLALEGNKEAPSRALIARDFNGAELERIMMKLDAAASGGAVALTPKGAKNFTLRIDKYVIEGSQK